MMPKLRINLLRPMPKVAKLAAQVLPALPCPALPCPPLRVAQKELQRRLQLAFELASLHRRGGAEPWTQGGPRPAPGAPAPGCGLGPTSRDAPAALSRGQRLAGRAPPARHGDARAPRRRQRLVPPPRSSGPMPLPGPRRHRGTLPLPPPAGHLVHLFKEPPCASWTSPPISAPVNAC